MSELSGQVRVALRRMETLATNIEAVKSRYGPRVDTSSIEFAFDQVLRALAKMQQTVGEAPPERAFAVQVWFDNDKTEGMRHEGVTAVEHHGSGCLHLVGTEKLVRCSGSDGRQIADMVSEWYNGEDWYAAEWHIEGEPEVCIVNAGEL